VLAGGDLEKLANKTGQAIGNIAPVVLVPPAAQVLKKMIIDKKDVATAANETIDDHRNAVNEAAGVASQFDGAKISAVQNLFGNDAAVVQSIGMIPDQIARSSAVAAVNVAADIIAKGKPVDTVVGVPLATALRQAKDYYDGKAKPLPTDIKILLSLTFPPDILDNARYVDSGFEPTLPAVINAIMTEMVETSVDSNHAVTVDNIIVFDHVPPATEVFFWAHEMQHTVQYKAKGIEGFAAAYTKNYKELEDEADKVGHEAAKHAEMISKVAAIFVREPKK
jgi:hypothetical protein